MNPPGGNPPGGNPPGGNPPGAWPAQAAPPAQGGGPPGGYAPPPAQGGYVAPPAGGPPPAGGYGAPPAGGPPGGGGGAPQVQFGEILENFKLLFERSKSGILLAMVAIAALSLLLMSPYWVANYLRLDAMSSGDYRSFWLAGAGSLCSSLWLIVAYLLVGALRVGISRPMRRVMVEGPQAVTGPGDALKQCMEGYWMNLVAYLLVGIALTIGAFFCVLPMFVVAFFVAFVPYLVSARHVDIVQAFKLSATYAQKQWLGLLASIAIVVLLTVIVGCCIGGGGNAIALRAFGLKGTAAVAPLLMIVGEAMGIVSWLFFGATLVTLETAESGTPIQR